MGVYEGMTRATAGVLPGVRAPRLGGSSRHPVIDVENVVS